MCACNVAAGETHFEDVTVPLAPPARPMNLSPFSPTVRWAFFQIPAGWYGDWHPAPGRQVFS